MGKLILYSFIFFSVLAALLVLFDYRYLETRNDFLTVLAVLAFMLYGVYRGNKKRIS